MKVWEESKGLCDEVCEDFKQEELDAVLEEVKKHFSDVPGKCTAGVCRIVMDEDCVVVNLPPRQIPFKVNDGVAKELEKMERCGVIESSEAEWNGPLVAVKVKKPDGSVRVLRRFRKSTKSLH